MLQAPIIHRCRALRIASGIKQNQAEKILPKTALDFFMQACYDKINYFHKYMEIFNVKWHLATIYAPIAQLVEQLPLKQMVAGSNPAGRTSDVLF